MRADFVNSKEKPPWLGLDDLAQSWQNAHLLKAHPSLGHKASGECPGEKQSHSQERLRAARFSTKGRSRRALDSHLRKLAVLCFLLLCVNFCFVNYP